MTYKEQIEWLLKNGFEEIPTAQQNMILWEKKLSNKRKLWFVWGSSGWWEVSIEQCNEDIWIMDLPDSQDFNKWQFLIDAIK